MMTAALILTALHATTAPPLLEASDVLERGATSMYTISMEEGTQYWILLSFDETGGRDLDLLVASSEMDYDEFIMTPYYEDYVYAREFALAEGATEGAEDLVLTAPYSGTAYIVVHDMGETGGEYDLRVF